MKILMLGWELPPHNSGGLGVACFQLCKNLSEKGADISFVVPYTAAHPLDFMKVIPLGITTPELLHGAYDSASVVDSDLIEKNPSSIVDIQHHYTAAIEQIVEKQEFNVIHAHDWLTFRAGLRAKELSGKPLIVHVHSVESDRAGNTHGNPIVHEIERLGLHLADQIVAVSELTKQKIVDEYAIPPSKIIVAHNSLDQSMLAPLDPENSYAYLEQMKQNGYKVVSNIGRITIQKGLTNLLYAAKEVIGQQPKTLFLIVGSGDQERELLHLSAELGISRNVIFVGFQRGKTWRDAFGIADLFVMPSVSEPFGLTPLEAIVYDTPSLISKQSGVSEVLHHCLKADFWDVNRMADQIVNVLRNDGLRETLLINTRDELTTLSWDKTSYTLLDLYRNHAGAPA